MIDFPNLFAGSGMLTEGRTLNYLEAQAIKPMNTLFFEGYQAEGTRERTLLEGAKGFKAYGK
ncbi:hypothetical protein [Lutimonas sp.]|uniref:hypothetical protein n=1 Tax=Lutimonas sp. TaxID=1872403 RepID=UPI003D9AE13A